MLYLTQVHQLRCLVQTQQDIIYSQKAKIEQLTETVQEEIQRGRPLPTVPPPATSSMDGMPPPPRAISPFAMQAVGYGDRRLAGLYDARFHSTHKCVWMWRTGGCEGRRESTFTSRPGHGWRYGCDAPDVRGVRAAWASGIGDSLDQLLLPERHVRHAGLLRGQAAGLPVLVHEPVPPSINR